MRTKAEQLLANALRIQPRLRMLTDNDGIWTKEVQYELADSGYIILDQRLGYCGLMLITDKARNELTSEERRHEETTTYLSADWSSGVTGRGRGTNQQDLHSGGSSGDPGNAGGEALSR